MERSDDVEAATELDEEESWFAERLDENNASVTLRSSE